PPGKIGPTWRIEMNNKAALLLAILVVVIVQDPLNGQVAVPTQVDGLARDFVKAINDRSVEERKKILHPRSASCINPQTQPFYDWIFTRQFKYVIPADYKVRTQVSTGVSFSMPEVKADYPINPTHILQIDYSTKPFSSTSLVLSIVKDGDRWY